MGGISQVNFSTNYGQFARPTASAPDLSADTPKRSSAVGNMLGTTVRESLDPKAIAKDALNCGVSNIPFDMLFSSQAYRRGDLKANEYVAHVVADSIGFSTWTVGGAVATFALGPAITAGLAFAPAWVPVVAVGAVGFAAGMLFQDLFDRAFGH